MAANGILKKTCKNAEDYPFIQMIKSIICNKKKKRRKQPNKQSNKQKQTHTRT